MTKAKVNEIVVKYGNPLYIIVYTDNNGGGMDYTTSVAEYLNLLVFHHEHSTSYEVLKVLMEDN
jgi:hypothetical protein